MFIRNFLSGALVSLVAGISAGHAMVLDPVVQAAESMGYEVVGDLEFRPRSSEPTAKQMRDNVRQYQSLCAIAHGPEAHFVILAWSDQEFPGNKQRAYSTAQTHLADQRAQAVELQLRQQIPGPTSFEHVNMATRTAQEIRPSQRRRLVAKNENVKQVLKMAGAAPSGELEVGLFGEYGQHAKAVIWVDCGDPAQSPVKPRGPSPFELAQYGED